MPFSRFFRRSQWDDERARELDAHLAIETDENIARGMTPAAARLAARRKLGNTARVREEIYDMNSIELVDSVWRDLKHGLRLLRLNPGFAVIAILSLALGVGANTAIFQLLDAVRIRTLPVADPSGLVEVRIDNAKGGRSGQFASRRPMLTNPQFEQIRDHQPALSGLAAWSSTRFQMATRGEARNAIGMLVNGEFFSTLGVTPLIGRLLTPADDYRGCAASGAVVSYGFWQRELGGDASAIGRTIVLDRHPYEVVGVTPPRLF